MSRLFAPCFLAPCFLAPCFLAPCFLAPCFLAALLLVTKPASAQLDPGVFPIDRISPVLPQMMLENVLRQPGSRTATARPAPPATTAAATTYRASPQVSARVKQQYVDFVAGTAGPQAAQQYRDVLARNDPVRNWATLVAEEGLRPDDVADAFASYWLLNWLMANGLSDAPGRPGPVVAEQVRGVLATTPGFAGLSEAQRQEMAELFMLNFLSQQAAYSRAYRTNDAALKRGLGNAAVTRFRQEMRLDLRALALAAQGFARKG